MNLEHAKKIKTFFDAWVAGIPIEYNTGDGRWSLVEPHDCLIWEMDFTCYRIKPTPTLRPWRPEEVPVGALIRYRQESMNGVFLITASSCNGVGYGRDEGVSFEKLAALYDYSLNRGLTWLSCGVME